MAQPNEQRVNVDEAMRTAVRHQQAGELPQAEQLCRLILSTQPEYADAWNLLAILAHQAGVNDVALGLVNRAIALNPASPEYHSNRGNLLLCVGQLQSAVDAYRTALALKPDLAQTHNNLGSALNRLGHTDAAIGAHQQAIRLKPNLPEAHSNLANALVELNRIDQAIAAHRVALSLRLDHPQVHWNLATCLLLKGDFEAGWREFEWRLRGDDRIRFETQTPHPMWDGRDLGGRTILLRAEQGLGDTLQFIRYAKPVHERGGRIIVECQPELIPLLMQLPHVADWIPRGKPLPEFDAWCSLMSLPFILGVDIPPQIPLLRADADCTEKFRERIGDVARRLKVGLVWAGRPEHLNDRNRSIPFQFLTPLLEIPGCQFFSLQKGTAVDPFPKCSVANALIDLTDHLHDFSDTAALIANLDLVISVDTAVAHLAGAMGKPAWVLLPYAPDWRWMLDRRDSPWYPSVRLCRQLRPMDWESVIRQVRAAL